MKNIVVFASGSGTNFQSVIDSVEAGRIKACIRGLITNKTGIQALERARTHGIETRVLAPSDFDSYPQYEEKLLETLDRWNPDLIVLAGYMVKIPSSVTQRYQRRIINIHPSLLPKYGGKGFFGRKVHAAVLANDESISGCTVHYVNEEYDRGAIIDQIEVPVREDDDPDSLAARVLEQEHNLLPSVIADLLEE